VRIRQAAERGEVDTGTEERYAGQQHTSAPDFHVAISNQFICRRRRATAYSASSFATTWATGAMASICPTPCPALQMSRQTFFSAPPVVPKFILFGSDFGRLIGSKPAATTLCFR